MKPLDPSQLPLSGRCLIEASAGTGKTYTITTLVMRLLIEQALELEQILIVTYTRAATAELKERVRARVSKLHVALAATSPDDDPVIAGLVELSRQRGSLQEDTERVERALYASDQAAIFTIHGFCQRVLTDFAFEADAPFEWELMSQSEALVAEVAHDYWTLVTHTIDAETYARLGAAGGPEALVSLIARTLHGQLPRLLPESASTAPAAPDTQAWLGALGALRERVDEDRQGLTRLLLNSKLRFGEKTLPVTLRALDEAAAWPYPPLPEAHRKQLFKLTEGLRAQAEKLNKPLPTHAVLTLCDALYAADVAYTDALDAQVVHLLRGGILYAREELERRTQALGRATFDQLLGRTHAALVGPRGAALGAAIRARYQAALIDEFQDTDPLQYAIFDAALGRGTLLLIGDPKQAIYGFRGADVYAYLNARGAVGDHVYTMATNYRSDPGVIAGLNHLYAANRSPFALDDIRYEPVAPRPGAHTALLDGAAPVELLWMSSDAKTAEQKRQQVATRTASDIVTQLQASTALRSAEGQPRALRPGDIAVLCRTNRQARLVQHELAERGVPGVLQGDDSVFDTPDALEVERAVAALADPHDSRALRSALAGQYVGLGAAELDDLEAQPETGEDLYARFLKGHQTWLRHGFVRAFRAFLRDFEVDARLLGRTDGSRRWTNLQHLLELLQEAVVRERLGPPGLLRWLRSMRSDVAKRAELLGQATQIRLESHGDAVTLTTVHRSKGLEYPVVYVPFAWDGKLQGLQEKQYPTFHRREDAGVATLDLGSADIKPHRALAEGEARSEALRLLYVALTRARHAVRVVCPSKPVPDAALSMLLAPDADKDGEAFRTRLETLAANSDGTLALRALPEASERRYAPDVPAAATPRPRKARRKVVEQEQISSFSSLSQERPVRTSLQDEGADHDEQAALQPLGQTAPRVALSPDSTWVDFPRGASAGTLVHTLLENVAADAELNTIEAEASKLLPGRGLSLSLASPLAQGVHDALRTPLDDRGLTLASITAPRRVAELEFMFRVDPAAPLDGRALAAVLERHRAPTSSPHYAKAVARLPLSSLRGYLRGFIDLVFEHEGRYFIVDYKSNHLGDHTGDYLPAQLYAAMGHHHYYLQYLLYSVALQRYLARRLPGYDHAQHFGGVYYLFLRGMAPAHGPSRGVFFDRPSAPLLVDLDRTLHGAQREAG